MMVLKGSDHPSGTQIDMVVESLSSMDLNSLEGKTPSLDHAYWQRVAVSTCTLPCPD